MDAVNFWLNREVNKVEADCLRQIAQVNAAKSLADVVKAANVHLKAELRALRHTIPGIRRLEQQASARIRALLAQRLTRIQEATTAEQALRRRGRLMADCEVLRGKFSQEYRYADQESQRLVYLAQQKAPTPPADAAPAP